MLQNLFLLIFTPRAIAEPWATIPVLAITAVMGVLVTLIVASVLFRYYILPSLFPTEARIAWSTAMALAATAVAVGVGVLLVTIDVLTTGAAASLTVVIMGVMVIMVVAQTRQEMRTS